MGIRYNFFRRQTEVALKSLIDEKNRNVLKIEETNETEESSPHTPYKEEKEKKEEPPFNARTKKFQKPTEILLSLPTDSREFVITAHNPVQDLMGVLMAQ